MNSNKPGRKSKRANAAKANEKPTSYRLSPQHKFALTILHRQLGTDKIAALQQAIEQAVVNLGLSRDWLSLYDDDEAVAELNLYSLAEFKPSTKDQKRRQFIHAHTRFFYTDKERLKPNAVFARILWPRLDEYAATWFARFHEDYNVAAKMMAADIKRAGKKPPAIEAK